MKVMAINGSPRKNGNTATLLNKALEGASAEGAETEMIHLYDLDFKGCISCFACKRIGGKSYGRCAVKDALTPVLDKVPQADAIILGSPIYFGNVTGEMRSFMERLVFPYLVYDKQHSMIFPKKLRNGSDLYHERPRDQAGDYGICSIVQEQRGPHEPWVRAV